MLRAGLKRPRKRRTEELEQRALIQWFRKTYPVRADYLTLASFGENIGAKRMNELKAMGLTPGYPDLFLAIPTGVRISTDIGEFWVDVVPGLFIEMKTKKGRITPAQREIHKLLRFQNYQVEVCRGFEEAKKIIEEYLTA